MGEKFTGTWTDDALEAMRAVAHDDAKSAAIVERCHELAAGNRGGNIYAATVAAALAAHDDAATLAALAPQGIQETRQESGAEAPPSGDVTQSAGS